MPLTRHDWRQLTLVTGNYHTSTGSNRAPRDLQATNDMTFLRCSGTNTGFRRVIDGAFAQYLRQRERASGKDRRTKTTARKAKGKKKDGKETLRNIKTT